MTQRLVEHSVRNNQVEVGIVMCEPGSPAKRYGGVHTGGEYNIQNDTRLCTSTCRAAPQFPPNPLDAAPAVGCTRARSCRGPAAGPPRSSVVVVVAAPAVPACTGTDPVTAVCPEAVQPRPPQPKGVLKAPPRRLWPREHQACHRRLLLRRLHGDPAI